MEALTLDIEGAEIAYGKAQVVFGVTLQVAKGECVAMLGANGAGKTTLLKAVSRVLPLKGGSIRFDGKILSKLSSESVFRIGICQVPEGRGLFPSLSVTDNILLGGFYDKARVARSRMADLLPMFPDLRDRGSELAGRLSGGQQQMVAILRALMANPRILLLDEPTLGLSPALRSQVLQTVRAIADTGVGVLLVEQNARQALDIADRCYVMRNGRITYNASSADALANYDKLSDEYLGTQVESSERETDA